MKNFSVKRALLVTAFVGLWPRISGAGPDLSLGATYRSYPLSGVAEGSLGFGGLLYGAAGSPFSGYVRVALDGATAGTYNSGLVKFEFFPLGFLGGRAGIESVQNEHDYRAYDCAVTRCQGHFHRAFVEGELTLGAGPVFAQGRIRRERWTQRDPEAGDFIEPTSGFVLASEGQSETVAFAIAGVKLAPAWTLLGGVRYAQADGAISRMPFGLLRWTLADVTLSVGGGTFVSPLKEREATVLASFQWEIWPGLALK